MITIGFGKKFTAKNGKQGINLHFIKNVNNYDNITIYDIEESKKGNFNDDVVVVGERKVSENLINNLSLDGVEI